MKRALTSPDEMKRVGYAAKAEIPVTWGNVVLQVKRRFGKELRRNVLSQKEWDGRKLVSEALGL